MKPNPSYPKHRAKTTLVACLAAMLGVTAVPALRAADDDAVKQLQEENAALRKRLAELEGQASAAPAASTTTTTTTTTTSANAGSSLQTDEGVQTLGAFEVTGEKDYGYLKTNATTATRIGMEIQKVPMNVQVLSSEFIQDTNMRTFTDIFKYTASASGDPRFAVSRPSNEATPQGGMTLRGFPVNIILRNGILLYSTKSQFDNVERVEIVKGPAAVFFGQGYPGGVINYITKRASLSKIPNTIRYTFGENDTNKLVLDVNTVLSKNAAFRVVGAWEHSAGERSWEYTHRFDVTPSVVLTPFNDPSKLKLTIDTIYLKEKYNTNQFAWLFPQGWFDSYANPTDAYMNAGGIATADDDGNALTTAQRQDLYRARIFNNLGNWRNDMRVVTGNPEAPLYTSSKGGAYYLDANGNRIYDEGFNWTNAGSYVDNEQTTSSFTLESSPTEWLDIRYVYTKDKTNFNDIEGYNYPNADGVTFNSLTGGNGSGYWRKTTVHQLDAIFKLPEVLGVKSKLLAGYNYQKYMQQYWAPVSNTTPIFNQVPGFNYPAVNTGPGSLPNNGLQTGWNVPVNQVLRDRNGNIMSASDVYYKWDPGIQIAPPADKVFPYNRNLLDGYPTQYNNWYVNWQGSALDDRLTMLLGFRRETRRDNGQWLTANYPWFSPPNYAFADTVTYPSDVYNYSPSYAGDPSNFITQSGDSKMAGVSFEIAKDVNIYASYSQTFRFNNNTVLGGYDQVTFPSWAQTLLDAHGGSLVYKFADGTTRTITSVAEAQQAVADAGANVRAVNEDGVNYEVGVKTSLWDNKLVTTFALFRAERHNQLTEDPQHQSDDIFNYNETGAYSRHFRWRSNAAKNRVEGFEAEGTWTPIRNFQSVTNFSWLWTAKTLVDPSMAATNINHDIYFGNRLENVPEYKFSSFNRYTFSDGPVRGLSFALGINYASEEIISRSVDWNPDQGGFTAGDYITFDVVASYPWEIPGTGYKINTQLGIYNATDKEYFDGGYVPGPRRTWTISNTLTF